MKRELFFLLHITLWVYAPAAIAQIQVAPLAFELNSTLKNAELYVYNNGQTTQEVILEAIYGVPQNRADGSIGLLMQDSLASTPQNAAPWISLFPQRLLLNAGERQIVRVIASPPQDLQDAEYWSRIVVTSHESAARPEGEIQNTDAVGARLNLQFRTVLALVYRHGSLNTGINARISEKSIKNDTLHLYFDLERTGNAAFLGQADIEIRDRDDNIIGTATRPISVYLPLTLQFQVPVVGSQTATHWTATFHTNRHIPEVRVLQSPPFQISGSMK